MYSMSLDGTVERINVPDEPPVSSDEWEDAILSQIQPLSGPYSFIKTPAGVIFSMTGEQNTHLNLYLLDGTDSIEQLTVIETLVDRPLLSASAEFIAWRPESASEFLYRVRLLDFSGIESNTLYLHNIETGIDIEMPFFGKDPVWSTDGQQLVGARLNDDNPPLYELWQVDLTNGRELTIGPGCNPQFSPDGLFLAYDGHDNSQWQSYTDCLANGEVYLFEFDVGQSRLLTEDLDDLVQLKSWVDESADSPR
jgi:hypothetical protein